MIMDIKTIDKKEAEKQSCYVASVGPVEVRRCVKVASSWTDKKEVEHDSSYLQITCLDDDRDEIFVLLDRDLDHAEMYKRGTVGVFQITVDSDMSYGGKTKIYVADFKAEEVDA